MDTYKHQCIIVFSTVLWLLLLVLSDAWQLNTFYNLELTIMSNPTESSSNASFSLEVLDGNTLNDGGCNFFCVNEKFASIHLIYLSILLPVALILNSLTIVSVCKFRWMRSNCNILIAALAVADIFRIVWRLVYVYALRRQWSTAHRLEFYIIVFILSAAENSGILHIVIIGLDRFVAIFLPLRYVAIMTCKKVALLIVSAWGLSIFLALIFFIVLILPQYGIKFNINSMFIIACIDGILLFIVSTLLICLYVKVTKVALNHRSRSVNIASNNNTNNSLELRRHTPINKEDSKAQSKKPNISKADIKATKMMMMVLGSFATCRIPCLIGFNANFIFNLLSPVLAYVYETSLLLDYGLAVVHVFIYAFSSSKFRLAYLSILKCSKPNTNCNQN